MKNCWPWAMILTLFIKLQRKGIAARVNLPTGQKPQGSVTIVVFSQQQEPVCNDSSNTTAPRKHDSDERRTLPGGGLSAHYARKLAGYGANETAQAQHRINYRSPVPVGRSR